MSKLARFLPWLVAICCLSAQAQQFNIPLGGQGSGAGPAPPAGLAATAYPRTAVNLFGGVTSALYSGNITGAGVSAKTLMSESSLGVVGVYFGEEQTYGSIPTLFTSWKNAASTNGLTLRVVIYGEGQGYTWTGLDYITALGSVSGGSGYTNGTYPNVNLTGGSGANAGATIVVSGGAVTSAALTRPGAGYSTSDTLSAAASSIGGTGSGFSVPVSTVATLNGAFTPWLTQAFNAASDWAYTSSAGIGTFDLTQYYSSSAPQSWLNFSSANTQTIPSFTFNGKTGVLSGYSVWNAYAQYFYDVYINGAAASKYGETNISGGDGHFVANSVVDGFLVDNVTPWATTSGTWNGVGTAPVANSQGITNLIMQGDAKLGTAFRNLKSNIILWGNIGYAQGILQGSFSTNDPTYPGTWDVGWMEATIGASGSIETNYNSPVGNWMQGMIDQESAVNSNGVTIFHQVGRPDGVAFTAQSQSSWTSADWQAVRFGFAAAMMRNAFYMLNCGPQAYNTAGLLDEQVQGGNYGWLSNGSQRLDPPQTASWSQGVWRRRFPNGWVLWNPRGNGSQTVTVPTTLFRITSRGYGDSTVNTGAQVTGGSVTLQDADGLFLIGTGSLLKPLAPAWADAANDGVAEPAMAA